MRDGPAGHGLPAASRAPRGLRRGAPAPARLIVLSGPSGVGKVRAKQIMERLGIAESRRVRGLGANQRSALEAEFGGDI